VAGERLTWRLIPVALAAVLLASLATACGSAGASQHAQVIGVAPGVSIRTPGGSVKVTSKPEPQAAASLQKPVQVGGQQLPSPLEVLATPRRITASVPPGGVVLSFKVSRQLAAAGIVPFLASLNPSTGRWVPVPSSYDPATGVVSAHITHFSIWAPLGWVKSRIAAVFKGALLSLFSLAGNFAAPTCSAQSITPVTITDSKPGRGVGACAEAAGSAQVTAKIVNQRPYPIDLLYPVGAHVDVPSANPFAQFGAAITNLVSNWHDRVLLPAGGGADATVSLPAGQQTGFLTESDGEAYLFGILGTAIRMLVKITGAPAETVESLLDDLDSLGCLRDVANTANTLSLSLTTAESIGSAAFDCLSLAAKGVSDVVFSVASIVASLAVELVAGIWGAVDNAMGNASHRLVMARSVITVRIAGGQDPGFAPGYAYRPTAVQLSGDSTYFLANMTWSTWSDTQAVGTGTAQLDDCTPNCAQGHIYDVPVMATFTNPVGYCTATAGGPKSVTSYFWSQVDLTYPNGLPAAVSTAASGIWVFSGLVSIARQSCA
jgi:hypothetical protein